MFKLAALLYVIIAPTVMGTLITVTLVVESLYNGVGISAAAALGAAIALPVSWYVAAAIRGPVKTLA
ncbi:CTP synthetase [Rubrimonas sp.]|uniref:CTP synthetase n=1 Tax=Rubrimonas sp. TaxID=2036015 RepID=UPI002FDE7DA5